MKIPYGPVAVFALTAVCVYAYPTAQRPSPGLEPHPGIANVAAPANQPPEKRATIEVVFVLDTTGSMSGLIQAAKEKIWSIASSMAQAQPAPEIRLGLLAYRDRGDAYVTQRVELSANLDSVYARLMELQAAGGGDGPESVNQAMQEAVHNFAWSTDRNAYRAIFLVGDAPPHMDYQDDVKYQDSIKAAAQRGIVVNTIQCGTDMTTRQPWQQIAQLGQGQYFQVDPAGSAVAIATPFDAKLASLAGQLDATRLPYGSAVDQSTLENKLAAGAKIRAEASVAAQARRAMFNATASGKENFVGDQDKELVTDMLKGKADIGKLERDALPASLRKLSAPEQRAKLAETVEQRQHLQQQIDELGRKRADYLRAEIQKRGTAQNSLDDRLFGVLRKQTEAKGLHYQAAAGPSY